MTQATTYKGSKKLKKPYTTANSGAKKSSTVAFSRTSFMDTIELYEFCKKVESHKRAQELELQPSSASPKSESTSLRFTLVSEQNSITSTDSNADSTHLWILQGSLQKPLHD